jgi:DNA-binding winged helix-turn-helix (wHTH) protein/tetratricopeptide (TPR) repeat protein
VERQLFKGSELVPLTDKVFELLLLLLQSPGRAVGKVELMERLWPDAVVSENNLTVNVSTLRKALGESAGERRYIETLARRGYRFIAEVRRVADGPRTGPTLAASPARAERPRATRPTFVGRERELSLLMAALEGMLEGRGRVLFITGDPGMGKTSLSQHFLDDAERAEPSLIVARGRCLEQLGGAEAYLPFLEALQSLLAGPAGPHVAEALQQHAPSWRSAFPGLGTSNTGVPTPPGASAQRMLRELADALEALSSHAPLLLWLEDLHWADPSSTDVVRLLAQRIGARRILLLGTYRGDEVEREHHPLRSVRRELLAHEQCEEIPLPLLGEDYIARYLDARCPGHDFPAELARLIVNTTEGQPLFATRLVELWIEHGALAQHEAGWRLSCSLPELSPGVPDTVRALIENKLTSLDEADRRALAFASAIGVEFDSSMLALVVGEDEVTLEERLDRLARTHHLVEPLGEGKLPDGGIHVRYRFAHVLYRNVLHEGLARKRRMALHAAVAAALLDRHAGDGKRIAAQLASHYREAREPALAIHHLLLAGDNASRVYADREARQYCLEAFALLPELPEHERVAHELIVLYNRGWTEFKVRDYPACLVAFERMLAVARSPAFAGEGEAASRARASVFAYLAQPWRDSYGVLEQPRMPNQGLEHGAVAVQCEALWAIVVVFSCTNQLDAMAARLLELLELAESQHNEPRRLEALALLGIARLDQGRHREGIRLLEECIPAARALGHARALCIALGARALVHHLRCELVAAEAHYRECLALVIDTPGRIECLLGMGLCHAHLGLVRPALAELEEALHIARRAELADAWALVANAVGDLQLELGAAQQAREHYTFALELAERHDFVQGQLLSWVNQGRVALALGEAARAAEAVRRADQLLPLRTRGAHDMLRPLQVQRRWLERRLLGLRAELELTKAPERAAELAARLLGDAGEWGNPHAAATARLLLARAELSHGRLDQAETELTAGLSMLADHPAPFIAWRLFATLAEVRGARPDASGAEAALAQARALVEKIADDLVDPALRASWSASTGARLATTRSVS